MPTERRHPARPHDPVCPQCPGQRGECIVRMDNTLYFGCPKCGNVMHLAKPKTARRVKEDDDAPPTPRRRTTSTSRR